MIPKLTFCPTNLTKTRLNNTNTMLAFMRQSRMKYLSGQCSVDQVGPFIRSFSSKITFLTLSIYLMSDVQMLDFCKNNFLCFGVHVYVSFAESGRHTKVKLMNICRNGRPKKTTSAILVFPRCGQNMSAKLLQRV